VRQKVLFDVDLGFGVTRFSAPSLHVVREAAWGLTPLSRLGLPGKQFAVSVNNPVYLARLGRGVRPVGLWWM
ncbi:hypothetical protein, partial [Pseudomonas sp. CCC4.4]|uniref:hypothetical protein n=1 Tax=Pseudomonas sp. CCC4.4 TaxID=3048612 RepID=UPI002B225ED7